MGFFFSYPAWPVVWDSKHVPSSYPILYIHGIFIFFFFVCVPSFILSISTQISSLDVDLNSDEIGIRIKEKKKRVVICRSYESPESLLERFPHSIWMLCNAIIWERTQRETFGRFRLFYKSNSNQKWIKKKSGGRRYSDVASLSSKSFAANAARLLLLDDMSRPSLTPMFPKRLVKDPWKLTTANAGTCRCVSSRVILQEPHWITFKRPIKNQPGNQTKQQKIMKFPRRSFFFVSIGSKFIGR